MSNPFKPKKFEVDNDRFYYEPRVLWSTARVGRTLETATTQQQAGFVKLNKNHLQNGSKYPILITHTIFSPVGYLFSDVDATLASQVDQCMAGLGRVRARISFPKSSWIERVDTDIMSFANVATGEPSLEDDATLDRASGLFGVSRWTFEPSLMVPSRGSLMLELSAIQSYTGVISPVTASIIFHERGGRMLGHGRHRAPMDIDGSPSIYAADGIAFPRNHVPVIGDAFAIANGVVGQGPPPAFPPTGKFPESTYNHQKASRGLPYTEVTGFAVALDQIDIDDQAIVQYAGGGRLAPIAQRIVTKAKSRDCGTQERWWRDGAPLSLVTPTMNNAGWVHKWDEPFVLGPGEFVEVSLQAPPPRTMTFNQAPVTVNPIYNVGVSFLGCAVVEDNSPKVYRDFADTAV